MPSNKSSRKQVTFLPDASASNPYQLLLANALSKQGIDVKYLAPSLGSLVKYACGKPSEITHLHWVDKYILSDTYAKTLAKVLITLLCFLILRLRGSRQFYTLHNLTNHENHYVSLERFFFRCYFRWVDTVFTHCEASRTALRNAYGVAVSERVSVAPHGNYIGVYPTLPKQTDARRELGISSNVPVFLFFGQIRQYKGVGDLLHTFQSLPGADIRLIIAGKIMDETEGVIIKDLIQQDNRVILKEGYIEDTELATLFSTADVFISPFRNILTSGSIVLAASYGLPCIAPTIGCIPETLPADCNWLYDDSDESGMRNALLAALDGAQDFATFGDKNRTHITNSGNWDSIASILVTQYRV